ncbi:MAG: 50S ribosomal protein L11 methyltransferase [Anaerolineales bacterium]|nr:50S ribosomal protein L11 methyltransferase [Anaerolineales bacterium]
MSNQWLEVSLDADNESAEAIADLLQRFGHQGVVIEQAGFEFDKWEYDLPKPDKLIVKAYLPINASTPDAQQQLRDALRYMNMIWPMPEPQFRTIDEADWAEAWKVHYQPLRLGRHIYIKPRWIETLPDAQSDDVLISLDPGMAFGTGTHPSTQLCLLATEDLLEGRPALKVLDLGCGSGILAIAAAKLGAAHVLALDTDTIAVEVTAENAIENGVGDKIESLHGSLDTILASPRRFDVALVNILARVIIEMCEQNLGQVVRPGGIAVFGGIIHEQADEVEAALRRTGLEPYKRRPLGDWVVIEAKRPTD